MSIARWYICLVPKVYLLRCCGQKVTKGVINYPHATSSFTLGIGVKTEGNHVISGTIGYVYVPAPWWLTSYFEVRYEDQTKNKKYFYSYDGEGLRYEIQGWLSMIVINFVEKIALL